MKSVKRVKLALVVFALLAALFGLFATGEFDKAVASVNGPSPGHTNAPLEGNCTSCHTGNPINGSGGNILIEGLPANYKPGQQIPLTVTVNHTDAVKFGFQLTAIDNQGRAQGGYTFSMAQPIQLQQLTGLIGGNMRRYIEHTADGAIPTEFNRKSWSFTWTAPAVRTGKISFYAAGNGANSDGVSSGDFVYTTARATLSG
ncbi:MAG: hypothetical protein LC734_04880, partial [Acidobacteria bacterium]|nr:hypothetical protein [Acidobacteriota bacterium]